MLEDELEKKEESKVVTLKEYLDGLEEVRLCNYQKNDIFRVSTCYGRVPQAATNPL